MPRASAYLCKVVYAQAQSWSSVGKRSAGFLQRPRPPRGVLREASLGEAEASSVLGTFRTLGRKLKAAIDEAVARDRELHDLRSEEAALRRDRDATKRGLGRRIGCRGSDPFVGACRRSRNARQASRLLFVPQAARLDSHHRLVVLAPQDSPGPTRPAGPSRC